MTVDEDQRVGRVGEQSSRSLEALESASKAMSILRRLDSVLKEKKMSVY